MAGHLVPASSPTEVDQPSLAGSDYQQPAPPQDGAGINVRRILSVLQRYRWWLLGGAMVGGMLGFLVARLIPTKYQPDATVWIANRDRDNSERTSGPIRSGEFLESRQWPELLESYVVLDSVVQAERLSLRLGSNADYDLFGDFQFDDRFAFGSFTLKVDETGKAYSLFRSNPRTSRMPLPSFLQPDGIVVERGALGDSIGRSLGWRWAPAATLFVPKAALHFGVMTPREASQDLFSRLTVRVEGQQFIRLQLTDNEPQRAARTLNALTEQFVRVAVQLKKSKLIEGRDILAKQTEFAYQRLKESELELENFRIRTVTLPSLTTPVAPGLQSTTPTVIGEYFTKKRALDDFRRDRQAIIDLLNRSKQGELTVDAFQTIPSVANAPDLRNALTELSVAETELRGLRMRYTDSMKSVQDMRERISTLRTEVIPQLAQALANQLARNAQTLEDRINIDTKELAQIPERNTAEQRLQREFDAADVLFKTLRGRLEAAQLAEASEIPDLKILDPAVPPRHPSGVPKSLFALAGLLGGAVLVAGLALSRDFLDKRIQYPGQVTGGNIGLNILGVVPDAHSLRGLAQKDLNNQVVEAFREIRLNIVHSFPENGPVVLTISSPSPQDGKSFVSANLAMSFAEAGYRTILVDGDTRRGLLHNTLRVERLPGLIDHLLGTAGLDDIIRTTAHPGLSVIPCGERRSQGPELLGNVQMRQLLDTLRARYDVVLFDSPPFAAGIDAYLLGTLAGGLLTVMRSGQTDRELAEAKLKLLDRLPIRLVGAVLNAVTIGSDNYKYYGYSYGYAAEGEQVQKEIAPPPVAEEPVG